MFIRGCLRKGFYFATKKADRLCARWKAVKRELLKAFNEKVDKYRIALSDYAKRREWDAFEKNAAELFDYVERIEISVVQKRFQAISNVIIVVLFVFASLILKVHIDATPELIRMKRLIVLSTIGGGGFEFYFVMNFRLYMERKKTCYRKRRERFVKNIEDDFRNYCIPLK
jgi:hypothetical protein